MNKLRKVFTISVMLMTILSMSVVVAPSASAAAGSGDLVKVSGASAVYYIGSDNRLYVFPNEDVYKSWYSDFSSVVTISATELNGFGAPKANITMRPGTKLVKRPIPTAPEVYAVEPGGVLRWIDSEETAITLYGANWADRVVDVVDSFFTNYQGDDAKTDKVTAVSYPAGSLVKFGSSADVYYINTDGKAQKITTESVFVANRFSWENVLTATIAMPETASDITTQNAGLVDTASGAATTGTVPGTGTGLSVALASDNPASATVIANGTDGQNAQALVSFVKLNFTASADGAVKVTNLKLKRTGISADSDVDALYLYDGDSVTTMLADGASVSSNYVTFNNSNGIFTVPAGATKSVTLRGDLLDNTGSGKTIGFQIESASDVTTDGATVSGSFPATGNLMSTAQASDLGQLSLAGGSYTTPTTDNVSVDADQLDYQVWSTLIQSTNQEIAVEQIKFTVVGSVQQDDLANFKLYANSDLVSSVASLNSDMEVIFDLSSNPLIVAKGGNKTLSLRADIVKGSTREFYMSFQNATDVVARDTSYGVYVQPYLNNTWAIVKPTGDYRIAAGSLSVSKATTSPNEDVVLDGTNVLLATYEFRASGEDVKVKNLLVEAITTSRVGLDNVKVYQDGVQRGSTADIAAGASATSTYTFGSTFIVPGGQTSVVKIYGDVKKADGTSFSDTNTIQIGLYTGSANAQSMNSLGTLNVPASVTQGNALTITAAALTVSKYSGFGGQTVVAGSNAVRMGSFVLSAGASEGANISSVTVTLSDAEAASVTNMYLKDNATGTQLGDTKVSPSTSNIISVNFSLPASGTKVIDLYADVKSGSNPGSWIAGIDSAGSGLVTGSAVDATVSDNNMQTMTIGNGALYPANGTQPTEGIVLAGVTGNDAAQFSFTSSNEGFTVSKVIVKTEADFASATAGVTLKYTDKDGAAKTATATFISSSAQTYATATFTGLTMYVPKDSTKNIDVVMDTVAMSSSGQTSGNKGKIYLDFNEGFQATGDSGTSVTSLTSQTADLSGNNFVIRKSKPTFTQVAVAGNPSSASSLFRFSVVADAKGDIEFKQLGFGFTTSGVIVTAIKLYDSNGTALTDTGLTVDSSGYVKLLVGGTDDNDVQRVSTAAKTYDVKGTVSGWGDSGDSMTVRMLQRTTANVATDLASAKTVIDTATNYIVWSDLSIQGAAHTTATADWANGYLLKNLDNAQDF